MVNIFSSAITPRLQYVLGVIFRDHLRTPYHISADKAAWLNGPGTKIHYSDETLSGSLGIPPSGLLAERYVPGQPPLSNPLGGTLDGVRQDGQWTFDLFGAVFYLLSRYEEYLDSAIFDHLGRFDPAASWAGRSGVLERPLVDEWIRELAQALGLPAPMFRFSPTYDIDQPWCYRHKDLTVNALSGCKSLLTGRWGRLGEQGRVLRGLNPDPFDNYDWLDALHASGRTEAPVYFFPVSASRNAYDKNPSPGNPSYQTLILEHSRKYPVGIHPSFYSLSTPGLLAEEVAVFARITALPVTVSRFHYIHFRLPSGYRALLDAGIRADYSMGYGERNGFRASYSRPFPWYDLEEEKESALQVVPFSWMEATGYHNLGLDAGGALAELRTFAGKLKPVGGRLNTIWHNNSLGEHPRWVGWRKIYNEFWNDMVNA